MTGKEIRKIVVDKANSYLGCKESNGSHKKIIDLYNSHKPLARGYAVKYTDEWCATFVSAVSIACGMTDIMPTECSCSKMIELYKKLGRWQESDAYVPSPGDLIMYDWEDSGRGDNTGIPNHVGIVLAVNGTTITVIEGNKNESVAYRAINVNGKYIRGYCLPDYDVVAARNTVSLNVSVLKRGSTGYQVKALQALLNGYGFNCGNVDGDFGSKTYTGLCKYQNAVGLEVDGSCGPKTWKSLLGA